MTMINSTRLLFQIMIFIPSKWGKESNFDNPILTIILFNRITVHKNSIHQLEIYPSANLNLQILKKWSSRTFLLRIF